MSVGNWSLEMSNLLLVLLILCLLGCDFFSKSVSVDELLNSPSSYINENVLVHGYFATGIGGMLYPSERQAKGHDFLLSIAVLDPTDDGEMTYSCMDKYVYINGEFEFFDEQYNLVRITDVKDAHGRSCWSWKAPLRYLSEN